jgi:hypothetical protein
MAGAPESVYQERANFKRSPRRSPPTFTWQGLRINLDALNGLAASLNPGDRELTPVQAWFELAARYQTGTLLDRSLLDALKREFKGVVKCVDFGAAIERQAFESVVYRMIGPRAL